MIKHFNYYLTGTGWAEVFFSNNHQNVRFDISYLTDPLSELFAGLYRLINNHSDTERIIFSDEPGEHSLIITRQDNDNIKVEIFWTEVWVTSTNPLKTQAKKEMLYSDNDSLTNFSNVICLGTHNLLERQTLDEYKQKWLYEFPLESYNKLRQAINLA